MDTLDHADTRLVEPHTRGLLARWPRWTAWAAMLWSAFYCVAGVLWWLGADWYPFGPAPLDRMSSSLLEGAPATVVGPVFAGLGLLGVAAAAVFIVCTASKPVVRAALTVGTVTALAGTVLVPDYTMLALLALWPALLVFAVTGVPGAQSGIGDILYWHRVNLLALFVGGLLWAGATLAARRRDSGRCVHCGRARGTPPVTAALQVERLRSVGRRFVLVAVLATLPYDITRVAWWLGWPLGLSEELYISLQDPPELLMVGLGLAALSTAGAALTHGLVAHWGEQFPRWLPGVGGQRVPVMLAVVPAAIVTMTLAPAALMFADARTNGGFDLANWGTWLPSLFWLLWAVGLGGATWAYHQRRRGACRHCAPRGVS